VIYLQKREGRRDFPKIPGLRKGSGVMGSLKRGEKRKKKKKVETPRKSQISGASRPSEEI